MSLQHTPGPLSKRDGAREEPSREQGNKAPLPWLCTTFLHQGRSLPEAILTISILCRFIKAFDFTGSYKTRTPSVQGGFQAAGIFVSLLMAFAGGALVGKQEENTER